MRSYDDRRTTLDPGLTALALRGRRDSSRFPFLEAVMRPRRWWRLGAGLLSAWRHPRSGAPPPRV